MLLRSVNYKKSIVCQHYLISYFEILESILDPVIKFFEYSQINASLN